MSKFSKRNYLNDLFHHIKTKLSHNILSMSKNVNLYTIKSLLN